jgi:SAM-dependent methyltransferase
MGIDVHPLKTAAAPSPGDTSHRPSGTSDFDDSAVAVAVSPAEEQRAAGAIRPAKPTTEIDVTDVVARLRRAPVSEPEVLPDFSLECAVEALPPAECHLVAVDACPVCGGEWARARYGLPGVRLRIVDCTNCGLGRLHPRPAPELIGRFYPASYYGVTGAKFVPLIEGLVRLVGARHVRALSRGLGAGARVLDVGCGRGVLLSALARRGFEAHGFEISPSAATGVDPRAIIRFGRNLQEAAYPQAYFDQVIIWHVLEHLPDPRRTLDEINRILKPGGRLVVAVPNYTSLQSRCCGAGWFHLDPPRHLFHFPADGLRRLLESTGFRVEREHHFSLRQNPFGWVQSILNCLPKLPRNGLYSLLKRRGDSGPLCGRATQFVLLAAYWLGMPAACVLSLIDTLLRRGASVSVVARSRRD